jgi:exonuclease SbcD
MFDEGFDYVALGHLHVPQRVGGQEHIRYSGSPIAMGFGEARQQKQVLLVQFGAGLDRSIIEPQTQEPTHLLAEVTVEPVQKVTKKASTLNHDLFADDLFGFEDTDITDNKKDDPISSKNNEINANQSTPNDYKVLYSDDNSHMQVVSLAIPCFQKLAQISGDLATIANTIKDLNQTESIWLEIIYDGEDIVTELREEVAAMIEGLSCEVLKIRNTRTYNKVLNQEQSTETLQDLNEIDVFERCLTINEVPESQKRSLLDAYQQILHTIYHDDSRAE